MYGISGYNMKNLPAVIKLQQISVSKPELAKLGWLVDPGPNMNNKNGFDTCYLWTKKLNKHTSISVTRLDNSASRRPHLQCHYRNLMSNAQRNHKTITHIIVHGHYVMLLKANGVHYHVTWSVHIHGLTHIGNLVVIHTIAQ